MVSSRGDDMKYQNDQEAYSAGADMGRDAIPWSAAIKSKAYPVTPRQKRAFLEGFEYGEDYRHQAHKTAYMGKPAIFK
jgi:hypothetical protein